MNPKIKFSITFLFYFLFLVNKEARTQELPVNLRFSKFTTENGLSDNFIHDIIKDRQGYLWIATQNGMNRFDGVEFKTFFKNPDDSNSLLSNYVSFLTEDTLGRIWAATSGGLSMYNPSIDKFWNFIPPKDKYIMSRVYKVVKAHNGSLWFSTKNHLNTIDLITFHITSYPVDSIPPDLRSTAIDNFFEDHNGDFWFDSYHGLSLFDRKTHQIKVMDKDFGLSAFYDGGNGECWMGCWFHGLRHYNFSTKQFTDYFFEKKADLVTTRDIQSIEHINYSGLESYLWIATDNELAVFDLSTKNFIKYYSNNPELPTSLPAGMLNKVFYDGRNETWIATEHGLNVVRLNQLAFQTYIFPDLQTSNVNRICEEVSDPSSLLIGLEPGGILRMNKNNGKISARYVPEKKMVYGYNYINDFIRDTNGVLWMANQNGLSRLDPSLNQYRVLNRAYQNFSFEDNTIYTMIMNPDNTIWFASVSGLGKFDLKTETFKYYPHYKPEKDPTIKNHTVKNMMKDFAGNIWMATKYDGLIIYDPHTEKFRKVLVESEDISNVTAHDLLQSDDSTIWYTTGDKVFFIKVNAGKFQLLRNEKINGTIFGFSSDKKNNLYMATQTGLVQYEKATGRFIKYTTADGLYDNRLFNGFDRGSNGELYLRGQGYITIIDPENLGKKYLSASLILESMKIDSRDTAINFTKYVTNPLVLSYKQNQFSVNFRLLNFEDARMVSYSYLLEGWDKDWISSGTGNYASYSNLGGGNYILHVKAFNPDGVENPQQATMMIHIDSPFWETIWFRIVIVLAAVSVIYLFYRLRIQRLIVVERIRTQISRDLHDEIGSSLSSMHIMSTFAEESLSGNSPDTRQWMQRIANNTKEIMEKIRDIVWTLNSPHDITGNIITRMNIFISQTLEPKEIVCNFNGDEKVNDILHDFVVKRNVYLIFKEAVNNAAKYSGCSEVNIVLKIENKQLLLSISDNGKGFDSSPQSPKGERIGNGLINMRLRATEINATLKINSALGNGTIILLAMPLPQLRYRFLKKGN